MSTLLQIQELSKSFGDHTIFENVNVAIGENKKIGVIGRNGAGKTTLFKMILGNEEPDTGNIVHFKNCHIGFIEQHDPFEKTEKAIDFLTRYTKKEAWLCSKTAIQFQLTNTYLEKEIQELSGGFQMRLKLTAMLAKDPNFLLLDEPTNYLDLSTLILLEKFLQNFKGTHLVISHDREFLKRTCNETLDIENGDAILFPQPIDTYLEHKKRVIASKEKHNKVLEQKKKEIMTFVNRFRAKARQASQAQSKLKQVAKLEAMEIKRPPPKILINIPQVEKKPGLAVKVEDISIGYPERTIAENITIDIKKEEHIAIVGDNGQGKTTFLRTIADDLKLLDGEIRWMPNLKVGYYAQHVPKQLKGDTTVKQYLTKIAGAAQHEAVMKMASNFLFKEDAIKKKVEVLSGGERARLCLAGILLEKNDVLLLDEPTNHLDFETVEALGNALGMYNGTILFISHDRTFVNLIADSIIEVKNGLVHRYHYDYQTYVYDIEKNIEKYEKEIIDSQKLIQQGERKEETVEKNMNKKEIRLIKTQLRNLEKELDTLAEKRDELAAMFSGNNSNFSEEKAKEFSKIIEEIENKELEWMELSDTLP